MKTTVLLKILAFSFIMLFTNLNSFADNKTSLIYNPEEVDGVMVSQTVYKQDGASLINYMKYNYQYDDQNRVLEQENLKWDGTSNKWINDICIKYEYNGNCVTTNYYKWDKRKKNYILMPERTITMENVNL